MLGHSQCWNAYVGDAITRIATFNLGVGGIANLVHRGHDHSGDPVDPIHLPRVNVSAQSNVIAYNSFTRGWADVRARQGSEDAPSCQLLAR